MRRRGVRGGRAAARTSSGPSSAGSTQLTTQAAPAERPRLCREGRQLRLDRVERGVPAARDEPGVGEPCGDLIRLVAVEVEELDALVADRGHLAQRRLEVAGAVLPHRPELQPDPELWRLRARVHVHTFARFALAALADPPSGPGNGRAPRCGALRQQACKPDSVEGDHPSRPGVASRLERCTRSLGGPRQRDLLHLAPDGVWQPSCHHDAGGLLPHRFTLTAETSGERLDGGFLSVPLSVGFRRLGFPQRPALRCPDFPRRLPEKATRSPGLRDEF